MFATTVMTVLCAEYRILCAIPGRAVQGVQASSDCLLGTSATRLWRGHDCRTCSSGGTQRLAPPASKPNADAWGRYHNRKRAVWSLLPVWHRWNWPQRTENGKTEGVISQSRVKPNGAADPEGFSAVGTPR
jgi:hypothetical protein